MDMLGKVRRMKLRDGFSISQIAKRTGLARNTVKGWLCAPGDVIPKYQRRLDPRKLTAYESSLIMALKADRLRHKDARRTGRRYRAQALSLCWLVQGATRGVVCLHGCNA